MTEDTEGGGAGRRERGTGAGGGQAPGGRGTVPPEDGPLPNLPARLGQLVASPGRLFDGLKAEPAWVGAMALLVAASLATTFLLPEELIRKAMMAEAPADVDPSSLENAMGMAKIAQYVFSVLGPPLVTLIVAGALLFVFNLVLGGEATFHQLFSVSAHALLIPFLGGLLVLPLIISTGDPRTALALHLLVPGLEAEGYLYHFLHGLNVFGLWACAVLGVAMSRLYPARTVGMATGTIGGMYVGLKAVTALFGGGV